MGLAQADFPTCSSFAFAITAYSNLLRFSEFAATKASLRRLQALARELQLKNENHSAKGEEIDEHGTGSHP
jgi:hypothetical protein